MCAREAKEVPAAAPVLDACDAQRLVIRRDAVVADHCASNPWLVNLSVRLFSVTVRTT